MIINLRELKDGENILLCEESPEELGISDSGHPFEGPIHSRLVIYKIGESITAKGKSTCQIKPECARCLDPVLIPIQVDYTFVLQKGATKYLGQEDDETLICLKADEDEVDLGNEIKDYILLEIPMIPTCEVSAGGPCEKFHLPPIEILGAKQDPKPDPRWDALRALKEPPHSN
ncbi:MAG: DUF177 domain-containing protein [bacterium]|nr:DUF177 domain-containing protein [bacterium]